MSKWYYLVDGEQQGPVTQDELVSKFATGQLKTDELVWSSGMTDWTAAKDIDGLLRTAAAAATPEPAPEAAPASEPAPQQSSKLGLATRPAEPSTPQPAPDAQGSVMASVMGGAQRRNPNAGPAFLYISPARLIIMSILSLGLFEVYWIYKNWRYIKDRDGFTIKPFWRGWFGIFYCHSLFRAIHDDNELNSAEEARFSVGGLATGWVLLTIIAGAVSRIESDAITDQLAAIVSAVAWLIPTYLFLIPVQNYINRANSILAPDAPRSKWSFGQILCLMIGVPLWILNILLYLGMLVIPEA